MHVALLNQYYWPHGSATGQLITELGEALAARGHRVTAITARIAAADGVPTPLREVHEGVHVHRVPATRLGKGSVAARLTDYGTFYAGAAASLAALRPRPDVVLALTTPPLIALAAQLPGLLRRFPTVSLVQDVYPDIAVALGVVPEGGVVHRLWRAMAGASLRASPRVVVLSEPMRRRVRAFGVPDDRIVTIPNWALRELDDTATDAEAEAMRLRYGFGDRFVVMYSGNIGAGHTFDTLLDTAAALRDRDDVVFAFVGDGVRLPEVEAGIRARDLRNVRVLPFAPREDLAASLASADLHVVTMRDGIQGMLMPSKLYGILAAARPALFIGPPDSAVADAIAQAGCGASVTNGDVAGAVAAIETFAGHHRHRIYGKRGRDWLLRELGRERAVDAYESVLSDVIGARRRVNTTILDETRTQVRA